MQIPVFFALYKVLFVTIEMRHMPFYGWVKDLSSRDPTSLFNLFGLIPWDPPSFLIIGGVARGDGNFNVDSTEAESKTTRSYTTENFCFLSYLSLRDISSFSCRLGDLLDFQ